MNRADAPQTTRWRREQRTIDLLAEKGFRVWRVAGAPFDLVAFNETTSKLIRIEFDEITRNAVPHMQQVRVPVNVEKEIWHWRAQKKFPRVETIPNGRRRSR